MSKIFDVNLSKKEKHRLVGRKKCKSTHKNIILMAILQEKGVTSLVDFYIRKYCDTVVPKVGVE